MIARACPVLIALTLCLVPAPPTAAQCISGPVPFEVDFHVKATADLDEYVVWDPEPEMFLEIFVGSELICTVDEGDGWQFAGSCQFDVDEPYNPFIMTFKLWDSDEPLDDYTVDIHPSTPEKELVVEYDPRCGTVGAPDPAVIPGCSVGNSRPECRGMFRVDGQEAWIEFEIRTEGDVPPLNENSLDIRNLEVIQVVPDVTTYVAGRPTMVRLDAGNSHPVAQTPLIRVEVEDTQGNHYVHERTVTLEACKVERQVEFFLSGWNPPSDEAGFTPQVGTTGEFRVQATIDPGNTIDCPQGCPPEDCLVVDGSITKDSFTLAQSRRLEPFHVPWYRDGREICGIADEDEVVLSRDASGSSIKKVYPVPYDAGYPGSTSSVPLRWPMPVGDVLLDTIDFADPRPGLLVLNVPALVAGHDALVLASHDNAIGCNWIPLLNRDGVSAAELSPVVIAEVWEGTNYEGETIAHEIGHTFGFSEAPCPIEADLWAGIRCEDEYNFPAEGVFTSGFDITRSGDPDFAGVNLNRDGAKCFMGPNHTVQIGTEHLTSWICQYDYERALERLVEIRLPTTVLAVRVRLTSDGGGSILRSDMSRLTAPASLEWDLFRNTSIANHTAALEFRDAAGTSLQTVSFTRENVDTNMDNVDDSFLWPHEPDDAMPRTFIDVPLTVKIPIGATEVRLLRRHPALEDPATVVVADTAPLSSPPFTLRLDTAPSSFVILPGERETLRWSVLPSTRGAGGPPEVTSYVFVSEDDGETWAPVGAHLDETEFEVWAPAGGRFLWRVFATSGFETFDVSSEPDQDADGCGDSVDPDPDFADPDGADADGIAEVCDVCPGAYDPLQPDDDEDGPGNACDNCPLVANDDQIDLDDDAHGDACDCRPFDTFTWEAPAPVPGLQVAPSVNGPGLVDLTWGGLAAQAGPSVTYDVVHGSLAELRGSGGDFTLAACLAADVGATSLGGLDVDVAPGDGVWFLVRGVNDCATGTYATQATGSEEPRDDAAPLCD